MMQELTAWFGMKRLPFDKTIKPREALSTAPLEECTARLDYIKSRRGILLMTGDPGVGKTLALRRYVDGLNENLFRIFYTPLSTLNRIDLLRHINHLFGLPTRASKSANYSQVQRYLIETKEQTGRIIVLIIDEAHLLKPGLLEELRLLTNFRMDSYDPFILVLAGQSELKRIMEYALLEPLNQRIAMRYHMPPLGEEQTKDYVIHHLKLAGTSEPLLDDPAFRAVHEVSFGIPRRIGAVMEQALTYAMFANKRTISAEMVLKVKSLEG